MPSLDVRSRLLGRRFSANTQSVSIKIFRPVQILAGSCQKRGPTPFAFLEHMAGLRPDLPAIAQPVIYSSGSLESLHCNRAEAG